jgi:hypothetical protein
MAEHALICEKRPVFTPIDGAFTHIPTMQLLLASAYLLLHFVATRIN